MGGGNKNGSDVDDIGNGNDNANNGQLKSIVTLLLSSRMFDNHGSNNNGGGAGANTNDNAFLDGA